MILLHSFVPAGKGKCLLSLFCCCGDSACGDDDYDGHCDDGDNAADAEYVCDEGVVVSDGVLFVGEVMLL